MKRLFLMFCMLTVAINVFSVDYSDIISSRLSDQKLIKSVEGLLIFFDDTQIRNRPGKLSSVYDASDSGDGCKGKVSLNLPFFQKTINLPAIPPITVRNVKGEWTSSVHFVPKKIGGRKGKSIVAVPDSNLFVPSFVVYPMNLFSETEIKDPQNRYICRILKEAWHLDRKYKRGSAYNFWLPLRENPDFTGPYNIPVEKSVLPLAKAYLNPKLDFFWTRFAAGLDVPSREWVSECLNKELNTSGASALFNIPNDADDTSTAVALQLIRKQLSDKYTDDPFFNNSHNFEIDLPALMLASSYRDIGRLDKYEDGRDSWKGKNSGAFLTWYRDETMPIFSSPQKGIIPLGKNNVDAVVNANVVFALGLAGKKDVPGYKESIKLLNRAIEERTWPRCGLYYPQYVIFPYVVSRAFRDGGNNGLKTGMKTLLDDLLTIQKEYGDKKSSHKGAFPGGEDKTDYLATALGVTSLLNIGIDIAREEGKLIPYNKAIKDGIYYLLKNRKKYKVKNFDTVGRDKLSEKISGYTWDCGLFFSASFWDLAHWRSEAYTNAMVLEAFTKYLLGYEFGGVTIMHGRRLHIKSYRTNDSGFELDVK